MQNQYRLVTVLHSTRQKVLLRSVPDEIALKYPSARAPHFVVGNRPRTTTIAYDLKEDSIPADKLDEVKESFEQTLQRIIPGLVWKERKIIELAGRKWIYFEMTSTAIDTDIHNIMLVASFQGKMLVFNFNSTKEGFPKLSRLFERVYSQFLSMNRPSQALGGNGYHCAFTFSVIKTFNSHFRFGSNSRCPSACSR